MRQILETKLSTNYLKNIKTLLEHCSHEQQVEFALHCAQDCQQAYDRGKFPEVYKATNNCLELLTNWISDSKSVTEKQLETAAKAATFAGKNAALTDTYTYAAEAAYSAAYAATYAAATASSYAAAYSADAATTAAFYSDRAAVYAALAARSATADLKSAKLKEFYDKLFNKLIENLNKNTLEILYGN
jgi:hypothetical protein